jgi:D-alanyl-D-alanine carboxypeptidase
MKYPVYVAAWIMTFLMVSCNYSKKNQGSPLHSEEYNDILQLGIDRGFPGFIMAVQTKKEPIWIGATGLSSLEDNKPMLGNDRFHIASITKLFTSIVILQLIDEQKIDFSSPAIKYLDTSLVNGIPNIEIVTVGQLLDHSSGIYSFNNDLDYLNTVVGPEAFEGISWNNEKLLQLANENRVNPLGEPGSGHFYSDVNQILLAEIAANITGKYFRQLVFKKIIKPLHLENTGFYAPNSDKENIETSITVQGYMKPSKIIDDFITIHPSFTEVNVDSFTLLNTTSAVERIDASAGMVSTVKDLAVVGRALYKQGLVSKKSLEWLFSVGENLDKEKLHTTRQGIVSVRKKPFGTLYTSLGDGVGGINSMLAYHPESETVIVAFTNIFGNFDEHDFFIDTIIPKVLEAGKKMDS